MHNDVIGLLSSVPYIGAVIGMVLISGHSDRMLERRHHSALPYLVGAVGLIANGVFESYPAIAFAAFILPVAAPISGNGVPARLVHHESVLDESTVGDCGRVTRHLETIFGAGLVSR
jgi:hypothetical protein